MKSAGEPDVGAHKKTSWVDHGGYQDRAIFLVVVLHLLLRAAWMNPNMRPVDRANYTGDAATELERISTALKPGAGAGKPDNAT